MAQKISFTADDIPDLSGKVAIVTGGNNGIGYETVKQLAKHGATVYMLSRTESKATAAIAKIAEEEPSTKDRIIYCHLDLANLTDVVATAKKLRNELERLDFLVNNAGIASLPYQLTDDGIELTFQTNHVSPFAFTQTLLPLLQKTARSNPSDQPVRIVNVASDAHAFSSLPFSRPDFTSLETANAHYRTPILHRLQRYGQSKLANMLYTRSFNEKYATENIWAISIHPGVVSTGIWTGADFFKKLASAQMIQQDEGSIPSLFAATSPLVVARKLRGAYIIPGPTVTEPKAIAKDDQLASDLWRLSEKLLAEKGQ